MSLKKLLRTWLQLDEVHTPVIKTFHAPRNLSEGYKHVSVAAKSANTKIDGIESGEYEPILFTGWPSLHARNLMQKTSLHVLHGMSGSAKTQFALQVLLGTALHLYANNIPGIVVMNSLEMTNWRLVNRLSCALADVNWQPIERREPNQLENMNLLRFYNSFIGKLPIYIDDSPAITTDEMKQHIMDIHNNQGIIHLLVTDYGELFADSDANREREMDKIFRNQRWIAREYNTSVLAISQSTYSMEDSPSKYKIAGPNGTRYSRAIRNAADVIMEVWNPIAMLAAGINFAVRSDLDRDHFWILAQKFRNGSPAIDFPLDWKPTSTRLSDPYLHTGNFSREPELYQNLAIALDKFSNEQGVF